MNMRPDEKHGHLREIAMAKGKVVAICICPIAGGKMQQVNEVKAIPEKGFEGDRYATGEGSYNKGKQGNRQVTFMNGIFFEGSGFEYTDSRRNIISSGVELMWLIGKKFRIGQACFEGVKYCDPCRRPDALAGKRRDFKKAFFDRGGLIANVIEGGVIKIGDSIKTPPKGY